jgi:hypothetical protein
LGATIHGRHLLRLRDANSGPVCDADAAIVRHDADLYVARERGFGTAFVFDACLASDFAGFDILVRLDDRFGYLAAGDVIAFDPGSRRFRVLFRRASKHNSFAAVRARRLQADATTPRVRQYFDKMIAHCERLAGKVEPGVSPAPLDALDTFKASSGKLAADSRDPQRARLVDAAAYALWNFVVHRECSGFRETEQVVLKDYAVPVEAGPAMGVGVRRRRFSGGDARQRAIRYATREYGAYDEIELEPYARAD